MKLFWTILSITLVAAVIFFRLGDRYLRFKEKQAGRLYCEQNGLTFIEVVHYELHARLYFEREGIKSWANYETDKKHRITWLKESPLEKLERIKSKLK